MIGAEASAETEPWLITAAEFAHLLRISPRSLSRKSSARELPEPVRFGGTVRWRLEDVKNWIAAGCPPLQARENGRRRK